VDRRATARLIRDDYCHHLCSTSGRHRRHGDAKAVRVPVATLHLESCAQAAHTSKAFATFRRISYHQVWSCTHLDADVAAATEGSPSVSGRRMLGDNAVRRFRRQRRDTSSNSEVSGLVCVRALHSYCRALRSPPLVCHPTKVSQPYTTDSDSCRVVRASATFID
jgi:hypothetical protein